MIDHSVPAGGPKAQDSSPPKAPSLAFRLGLSVFAILSLVAAITIFAAYRYGWQAANEAYDRLLMGAALQISERVSVNDGIVSVDLPVSAFELLALARSDRVFYRIVDPAGATVSGYAELPLPDIPPVSGAAVYEARFGGETVRIAAVRRQLAERGLSGPSLVLVAHTMVERGILAFDIMAKAIAVTLVASIAILLLALLAMRYALSPLARIEQALLRRDPNDLSPLDVAAPRELETMIGAINRFMGRLNRRVSAMQSFVADAAHQMRTPITALRAQTEIALSERDPERLRKIQQRILARAIGVSRLTDQLLSQALITHRADAQPFELIDLRVVAVETDKELRTMFGADGIDVRLDLPEEELLVSGDLFSLREAVKNLVSNALTHGRAPVTLTVQPETAEICAIAVIDCGAGIPANQRHLIGQRFNKSESQVGSAGLGLAIVSEVVSSHGGTLDLQTLPDGRFKMAIHLVRARRLAS